MGWSGLPVRRVWRLMLVGAIAGLTAGALAACGGDSGGGAATTPGPTATPTEAPHLQPTVTGSDFNFPGHGYAATIPDGWHANPNSLLAGPQTVDTFFAADTVDGVQSNVSVTCETNPTNIDTQQFVTQRSATLAALGAQQVTDLGTLTVGGVQAQKIGYNLVRGDTGIAKVDVMFATPRCGWTLAAASAPSLAGQVSPIFDAFLQSFRLIGDSATPSAGSTTAPATPAAGATVAPGT